MATFKYLLETSTCIELLRGNERVRQHCVEFDSRSGYSCYFTTIFLPLRNKNPRHVLYMVGIVI